MSSETPGDRPLTPAHLDKLVPYVPGKPIEETEREYGVTNIVKLASNENCLGISPKAREAMVQAGATAHLYPDAGGFYLRARIAKLHGVDPAQVVLGNGTNELIVLLVRALIGSGEALLNAWPSFVCYRIAARAHGCDEITVPLKADLGYDLEALAKAAQDPRAKLVFLANPNNPTGRAFSQADLTAFFAAVPKDLVVVLDEAYAEYVRDPSYPRGIAMVQQRPRTVVLRTFSKVYGLAGLRIGYAVCDRAIADVLNKLRDAFNTSTLAQVAALAALDDDAHVQASLRHNERALPVLAAGLMDRGFEVTPSQGNFVMASLPVGHALDVPTLNVELLKRGVIVRPVGNYELPRAVRVTVGTDAENAKLLSALDDILKPHLKSGPKARPFVVALDGPAGAGKSTVAKKVAEAAGLQLVDTGAIYRSVALLAVRQGVSVDDGEALGRVAASLATSLRFEVKDGVNRVFIGSEDVSQAIRTPEMSVASSAVSRHPPVRNALMALQRALGENGVGAVLEGRDIGTIVFPDARIKAFVTASPEERARRRQKELDGKGQSEPFDKVLAEINARDKQDSDRAVAPLKAAADAHILDTTHKSLERVVEDVLALVRAAR
jgi:histidinol-phosphate aminotransferase